MNRFILFPLTLIFFCLSLGATEKPSPARRTEVQGRVQLELDEQLGASSYEIELQDSKQKRPPLRFSEKSPRFDIRVPVGKYLVRGRVRDQRKLESPWSSPEEVLVTATVKMKVPQPALLPALNDKPEEIHWQALPDITVTVLLEQQKLMSKECKLIEKAEKIEASSWKASTELSAGRYRWTVLFVDEVFGKSEPITSVFLVKPKAKDLDRNLAQTLKSLGI
jgi:hypothetical protein